MNSGRVANEGMYGLTSVSNSSWTDLLLTNSVPFSISTHGYSILTSTIFPTLVLTVFKTTITKNKPRVNKYRGHEKWLSRVKQWIRMCLHEIFYTCGKSHTFKRHAY